MNFTNSPRFQSVRVVDEVQVGAEVPEEQELADAVEHVGVRRDTGFRGRFGQDPMAEAVEVADAQAGPVRGADGLLDPLRSSRAALTL